MKGILADVNCEGHLGSLLRLMREASRQELWESLGLAVPTFADLGLAANSPDGAVWRRCQAAQLILVTGNRNTRGADSLEVTLRAEGAEDSLPVVTIGDVDRLLRDRGYAERAADKLLEILFDVDKHRGAGRLFIP